MKHLLYCGARYGETLGVLAGIYDFDRSWTVHLFEPNPYFDENIALAEAEKFLLTGVFHRQAVWIEDGPLEFRLQAGHGNKGRGSAMATLHSTNHRLQGGETVTVQAMDFSRFVGDLDSEQIVVRMDIEGAEFPVLRKMLKERTITRVRNIHIEWHHRHMTGEDRHSVEVLRKEIRRVSVNVFDLA